MRNFYIVTLLVLGITQVADAQQPQAKESAPNILLILTDDLGWHYPHYHNGGASPHGVIRKGQYRLIEHFDGTPVELYDIENDIGESVNLARSMPDKSKELLNELRVWRHEVGAQMPTLNANYDPNRVHEWNFVLESKKRQ